MLILSLRIATNKRLVLQAQKKREEFSKMQRQKLIALGLLQQINYGDGTENDESVEQQMQLMQRQEIEERKALIYQLVRYVSMLPLVKFK